MVSYSERRRAKRINTQIPTLVEVLARKAPKLPPELAAVYERVESDEEFAGQKYPAIVNNLSANGAFITGISLPLTSRVHFSFPLEGFGQVDVLGWVLWRRREDCLVPRPDGGQSIKLAAGFGVLFEAADIEARRFIEEMVAQG